jgi:heptosyltransferase-1
MDQPSKILIIKLSSIGDIVHTFPVVLPLREKYPHAKISWLVEKNFSSLLQNIDCIDQIYTVDTQKWRKNLFTPVTRKQIRHRIAQLRKECFDISIDFQGLIKSALFGWLSRAKLRIGFDKNSLREPLSRLFYHKAELGKQNGPHVIYKNLSLLNTLGINQSEIKFPYFLGKTDKEFASLCIKRLKLKSFAIINPGAGWFCKQWDIAKYAALADILVKKYNLNVLISWGPGEKKLASQLIAAMKYDGIVLFPTSILQLAALIERASLFIGSDSGPLHLATALRTPVVGILGPTDPERNGSFIPDDIIVSKRLECSPCYKKNCDKPHCMESISLDEIVAAVDKRLSSATIKEV